ncbi:T9SS type A sorting domain-containing protein [Aquimarina algiphila]|uniref:T9SS type A sorting domain-containing protein n=1 Tax=Aquimarina algiphila TaxID=2047982 RepID=A0A554VM38_9FLAO|nr:T9SS type A sorting domain-containing protein [Aquimarina algiphila]TSE09273.1 T9SS type A sorting domain-containing protein [Aquimarina algiphila]
MKHKFNLKKLLIFVFLLAVFSACNTNKEQKITEIKTLETSKKHKTKKDYSKKKGIEEIAKHISDLMKPIGAEKSTYEDGFMMTEHQKAMKNKNRFAAKSSSIINFKERGPVNVPGRIRGIQVAPDNEDKWYVGTVGGGLWLTEDAGVTWRNLTDYKVPSLSTSTVVISDNNPNTIYVGTGEPFGNLDAIGGIGVLKSTNAGDSWEFLQNTKEFGGIGRLVINPADENNLVVASDNGIFVTSDGGTTWQNTYTEGNVQDLDYDPSSFNTLYGGVNGIGVIKSTDGGLTWDLVLNKDDFNENHARFELDVSPVNTNKVFISVYTPGGNATTAVNTDFYVTSDAGASFKLIGFEGAPAEGNLITGQGWYDNIIRAHPFNENVFYAGGVVMHRVEINKATIKNGTTAKNKPVPDGPLNYTFQPIAAGYNGELNNYVHVDQHNITWITKGVEKKFKLILANDGGIYHTDYLLDPGTTLNDWSTAATGLNCTQFYGADKRNGVEDYIAGAQDNGTWVSLTGDSANDDTAYTFIISGDGFEVLWNYEDSNKFIGGSQYNGFERIVNGQRFNARHGESGRGTSPFYSKITNANNNPNVLFSPSVSGVWRSTNFAESWELTAIPNNFSVGASSALDVSVSTANPDVIWAGNAMTESGSYVIHVSKDNGVSYEPTALFSDPRDGINHNYFISGVETSSTDENRAYVLFSGQGAAKILKTEDLGQTWEDISGFSTGEDRGFPDVAIHSLVEMPFDENRLWVGTDIGVFQTLDGGKNWSLLAGLPAFSVWQMKIVNNEVVMATHGRGVWTAALVELEGYEPPAYFAPPTIVSAVQESVENQNVVVSYVQENEDAEKIVVYVDGEETAEITDNVAQGTTFTYTIESLEEGNHSLGLQAIDASGTASVLSSVSFDVIDFTEPQELVSIKTFEASDVYTFGDEFVINTVDETVSQAVLNNSGHPYLINKEYRTVLKHPITLTADNGDFTYEDVAITEFDPTPGRFYDYVTIEASSDLNNWVTLDAYDGEKFPEWTDVVNSGPTPSINDDLFKEQSINLLDFFNAGDVIAIRFRLISDPGVTSFGWAIRSINAEKEVAPEEEIVEEEVLRNTQDPILYPTISNGQVRISSGGTVLNSVIEVYGLSGRLVYSKALGTLNNSEQSLSLENLNSGMYLVKISGSGGFRTKTSRIIIN